MRAVCEIPMVEMAANIVLRQSFMCSFFEGGKSNFHLVLNNVSSYSLVFTSFSLRKSINVIIFLLQELLAMKYRSSIVRNG